MRRSRSLDALCGLLAFALTASVAELAAALLKVVSPRVAVGDAVIRLSPAFVVHFATRNFGTNDKTVLLTSIVAITLVFGAVVGSLARRRPESMMYGFALWWGISAAAVWKDQTQLIAAVAVTGLAAAVGMTSLRFLLDRAIAPPRAGTSEAQTGDPRVRTPSRRAFLAFAAASAAGTVAATAGARRFGESAVDVATERKSVVLPAPTLPLPAVAPSAALDVRGISPLITPNKSFYRIDTALSVPRVDLQKWRLRITGMVDHPQTFTYADLSAMPAQETDATMNCVSNEVGDNLVGNARWLGIPLPALLALAGVKDGATQVIGRSVDGFTVGFPTEVALDGRASMVALGMNGEPLPLEHGFPARLLVPGLYGYVSATKWLTEIQLTTLDAFDAYWIHKGWSKQGPIKTESRIDVPSGGKTLAGGRNAIAGVAWGGIRSISKVEVRVLPKGISDGPWMTARLGDPLSQSTWRQWVVEWDAEPGSFEITVRATDGTGVTQTEDRADPVPSGATGWHKVHVKVHAS